jgi:aryl-alcohol dehydrogenase-like predicted oxidoreductase
MRYREIGDTGISVSEVGFGVWTLATGWWGDHSDDDAVRLLREARERGITFFDTADTYGEGRGERLLQQAFGASDDVVIATKFGYDIYSPWERKGHMERPHDWTPGFVRFALEQSLARLGRETIDHYALHNPRLDPLRSDELFALLDEFVREGKVRSYGVALGPAIGWRDEGVDALRRRDLAALQIIHNALEQEPGRELVDVAREEGTAVIVRVPHSSGMLEGKYTADTVFAENDHRRHRTREWLTEGLQKIDRLGFLTASGERTLGQAALKWLLHDPQIVTTLPNIYGLEQLDEFAAGPDTPDLTDDEFERVKRLYDENFGLTAVG